MNKIIRACGEAPRTKILVIRLLPGLGDMLCLSPAARALRSALPEAHLALLGLPRQSAVASRFYACFDEFIPLPGYTGLYESTSRESEVTLETIRARRFDYVLQLHGSGAISNGLALSLGARHTAGFHPPGDNNPAPGWFFPYPDREHEIRRCLRLVENLGIPARGEHLEFPVTRDDREELREFAPDLRRGQYVAVHPGAKAPSRRWSAAGFAAAASALAERGCPVVLTGSESERELAESVGRAMRTPYRNLAGPIGVGALAALIEGARLLIANDTGVSHLAAAVRTPSVIVFTAADPARWAPLDERLHRTVMVPAECRPCGHEVCPIGHPCSERVAAGAVIAEALRLLGEEAVRAA